MRIYCLLLCFLTAPAIAQVKVSERVKDEMADAARAFLHTLDDRQRAQATYLFTDAERVTWDFLPHDRKGLKMKQMTPAQRELAWALLKTGLSESGYEKAHQITDLENVLRLVENRQPSDTFRDPEAYYVTIFGDASKKEPWGWRFEGHHLSVQFSSLTGQVMSLTPLFMGSNPGQVRADVAQKGREIMREETELAFNLLYTLSYGQLTQAVIGKKSFGNILTGNSRRASLERMDGLPFADMTESQQKLFLQLLRVYLNRYRITLANQQFARIETTGLAKLRFAWAGDTARNNSIGYYYRIHGPMLLIEYDNSQNDANHVHTVVRDLTNDFGDDLLRVHYERAMHD